ncbi:unnamed protein product, partial [Meganyctiphanes norvegica]
PLALNMASYLITLLAIVTVVTAAPQSDSRKEKFREAVCGSLTPQECRAKAGACHFGKSFEMKDGVVLSTCASQNGIKLQGAPGPIKSIDELLTIPEASDKAIRASLDCVYKHLGLMSNGVFDVEAVKSHLRSNIQETITDPKSKVTILGALDTCPQPTVDRMRNFLVCLSQTCVATLANL